MATHGLLANTHAKQSVLLHILLAAIFLIASPFKDRFEISA
jgi:hypothetical protein